MKIGVLLLLAGLSAVAGSEEHSVATVDCHLYIREDPKLINLRRDILYLSARKDQKGYDHQRLFCVHPKGANEPVKWVANGTVDVAKTPLFVVKHPGVYSCEATSAHCQPFNLTVIPIHPTVERSPNIELNENNRDNVSLWCNPSPQNEGRNFSVAWRFDNRPLIVGGGHIFIDSDNEFHIKKPKAFDSGIYLCNLTYPDEKGVVSLSEQNIIHVYSAPIISKYQRLSKDADEGGSVVFGCDFFGHPLPNLRWTRGKDDTPLVALTDYVEFGPYAGIGNASVKLSNLKYTDRDDFICIGSNKYGQAQFATLVRVKSKLAPLWPFLGIVLEVIALVTIILIFEHRRKAKAGAEADDEVIDSSKRSCQSTPDTDLRLRKK